MHAEPAPAAPAPQWHPPTPAPVPYRSPKGLAVAATVLLGTVAVVDLLDAAASFVARGAYQRLVEDPGLPGDVTVGPDLMVGGTSMLRLLVFLAAAVVFVCWFVRVRKNAELLAPQAPHARKAGWVGWGWIVPVVSFWFPYQIARDSWRASAAQVGVRASEGLLGLWWAAWLLTLGFGRVDQRMYLDAETSEEYVTSFGLTVVTDLVDVVAAVLAILVVRRLTAMQEAKAAQLASVPQV